MYSIVTFYLNTSLWVWACYLLLGRAACSLGPDNPIFTSAIVFVSLFGILSLLDCICGREG